MFWGWRNEPTAALDSHRDHQVMELFAKVAHESNAGVIVVTHDARALDVFDRIVEMEDARIKAADASAEASLAQYEQTVLNALEETEKVNGHIY